MKWWFVYVSVITPCMGKVKSISFLILFSLFFGSCALFQMGYIDENEQYVPKRPDFSLKDKKNNNVPADLDTVNIYRLSQRFENGAQIYPTGNGGYLKDIISFIKFYSNGRCLEFSILAKDGNGNLYKLKESDLNPNQKDYNKNYYFSKDGERIEIESFVPGDGFGSYVILKYTLYDSGSKIIYSSPHTKEIYIKEKIPANWKKYSVDW